MSNPAITPEQVEKLRELERSEDAIDDLYEKTGRSTNRSIPSSLIGLANSSVNI
jgi:hypothetical protein